MQSTDKWTYMWFKQLLRILVLYICVTKSNADIVIINNPVIPQRSLHQYEVQAIFTLRLSYWVNGLPITPVFINFDDPVHNHFVTDILRLTPYNFNIVIGDKIQQGDAKHVIVVNSVAEAISAVKKISGAVTYIPTNSGLDHANEIQVIRVID